MSRLTGNPKNKKDVRLVALRPQNRGIAKRLSRMYVEETILPRRNIYMDYTQNAHNRYIHRMSIDCFGPLDNFGEISVLDLKQNAFLCRWILHIPLLPGKANKFPCF